MGDEEMAEPRVEVLDELHDLRHRRIRGARIGELDPIGTIARVERC